MRRATASGAVLVGALGLTQIVGYGTLYYSFGPLAPLMAAEFSWPQEWVFGALSVSLLAGGLISPLAGRLADRYGATRVMTGGSAGAAAALGACALAPGAAAFVAGLVAIELASAFMLYATAFAALAQLDPARAQRRITHLTLIAGFASTVFWPLTSWLATLFTWREVYLIYALLNLGLAMPVHYWLSRRAGGAEGVAAPEPSLPRLPMIAPAHRLRVMAMMLSAFALLGFVLSGITVHMIPMLGALGFGAASAVVTTLFGPAQVLGRVVNMRFGQGLPQPLLAVIAAGMLPAALVVLLLSAPSIAGAALFALLFGLASGLTSIVSGTLPLVLFGSSGYGQMLGTISSARLLASASAPFAYALLSAVSTTLAIWTMAGVGLVAVAAFGLTWRASRTQAGDIGKSEIVPA